jgi:hypothetical protein
MEKKIRAGIRTVTTPGLLLVAMDVHAGIGEGVGQTRHGFFENGETPIKRSQLVDTILGTGGSGAQHHCSSKGGKASSSMPIRCILQLLKLVISHPEVDKATSNLLHEMSSSFGLLGGVGGRREDCGHRL